MSFLQQEKVAAAQIAFDTRFNAAILGLTRLAIEWDQVATVVPSSTRVTQHNWLGLLPQFTEWLGERNIGKLRNENYQIVNKKWANGLEVDVDDIDDDALGLYMPKIDQLAVMAKIHKINLMVDFLINGFATTKYGPGYDGFAFFSDSHQTGDGPVVSNLVHHTLDDSGAFDEAFQVHLQMRDENGEPLNCMPTHLIVGPTNRATARNLILAERNASGASNTNYKIVELIVTQKITDGKWFLLDLSQPIRPLIFQERRAVQFRAVVGADSMARFLKDKLYFGADGRYNVGYGLWQMAVGSDAST